MKKSFVIHPFLFAIFPILFLFAHNISALEFSVIFVPLAVVLIFTILALSLLKLLLRDYQKIGIIVSIFLIEFFSYGHFYNILEDLRLNIGGFIIGPNKVIFPISTFIFLAVIFCLIKTKKNLYNFTNLLNIVAFFLVLISLFNIGMYRLREGSMWQDNKGRETMEVSLKTLKRLAKLPNIYYIILDGYTSADILRDIYQFDNSKFISYLKQKGFYIANKSRCNYGMTDPSLASSLNFEYIKEAAPIGTTKLLQKSKVFSLMKQYGYTTVILYSWDDAVFIKTADVYLTGWYSGVRWLDYFQNELINFTPIPYFLLKWLDKLPKLRSISQFQYNIHREKINYVLDTLRDTAKWKSPFFIYAHIFLPHPPFVFGPDGEEVQANRKFSVNDGIDFVREGGAYDEYIDNYKHQVEYVNKKTVSFIDEILSKAKEPPIIILQGDHGPRSIEDERNPAFNKERFSILNAYYLPDKENKDLYESITPVNTFRILFNHYFGTNYPLLKDESYIRTYSKGYYEFINVTEKINADFVTGNLK